MSETVTYSRKIFDVADEASAKNIILTPEFGLSTTQRWETETPYFLNIISETINPQAGRLYIDYGCGIGRLSKVMIEQFDCRILGVDISERMRSLAPDYVNSQQFSIVSPHMLHSLVEGGLKTDGALSVWALQHCLSPKMDLDLIQGSLKKGASFLVINLKGRAVPTAQGRWANDGIDVRELLKEKFRLVKELTLNPDIVTPQSSSISFCNIYER